MASTRRRHRLKARIRRAPLPLRVLRGVAFASLAGLAGLVALEGLRAAGFQVRWQVDDPDGPPPRSRTERARPTVSNGSSRPDGPPVAAGGEVGDAAPTDPVVEDPPEQSADPAGSARPATWEFVAIDFETLPDGAPVCTNCPASDAWRNAGVVFSFHSWSASSTTPFVLDARNFLPDGASKHALGPALAGERGLEVGVTRLDFPGRPRKVAFTLYGPDLIGSFSITAWSDGEELPSSAQVRSLDRKYNPAGRGRFRAERVLIEALAGIDRIALDGWGPPGHVLLIDDLAIDP